MIDLATAKGEQQYLGMLARLWANLERPMINKLKPAIGRQYLDAATLLEQGVGDVDHAVDSQQFRMRAIFKNQYKRVITVGHSISMNAIELVEKADTKRAEMETNFQRAMTTFITSKTAINVKRVNDTTKTAIKSRIAKGIAEGKTHRQIAADLRVIKGITTNYRANMIARTETHGAFNFATDEAVKGTGMTFIKIWSAVISSRTRKEHLKASGQRRKQNEAFLVWGEAMMYPGEQAGFGATGGSGKNTIHCRCGLTYSRRRSEEIPTGMPDPIPVIPSIPVVVRPKPKPVPVKPKPVDEFVMVEEADVVMADYNAAARALSKTDNVDDLTARALMGYTEADYDSWNSYLRGKKWAQTISDKEKEKIAAVQRLFRSKHVGGGTKFEGTVYRGINFEDRKHFDEFIDAATGSKDIMMEGFVSTTVERQVARDFMEGLGDELAGKVMMKIKSRRGLALNNFSGEAGEFEVLLNHNARLKVNKVIAKGLDELGVPFYELELEEIVQMVRKKVTKAPMNSVGALTNCVIEKKGKSIKAVRPDPCRDYVRIGDGKKAKWFLNGQEVAGDELKKLTDMKIPPAWQQAVVSVDKTKKVQAIGQDRAGRWQYRYSESHIAEAAKKKFNRQKQFSADMPDIRKGIAKDMEKGDPRAYLLDFENKTAIRVGSDTDFKAKKKAYGLTTLQHEHAKVLGDKISLNFIAKEGIEASYELHDKVLAKWLEKRIKKTKPGEKLFPDVSAKKLNDYLKDIAGGKKYTVKDFRTYHGTRIAHDDLKQYAGQELTKKQKEQIIKDVSEKASKFLANTPVMARKSYINPVVWDFIGGL
jgi:DNA topoisomerase I